MEAIEMATSSLKRLFLILEENFLFEIHNYVLWVITFFALGIGFYFSLDSEPSLTLVSALVVLAFMFLLVMRRHERIRFIILPILFFLLGLCVATWRAELVRVPKIIDAIPKAKIYGVVEKLYPFGFTQAKMVLKVKKIYAPNYPKAHKLYVTTRNFNQQVKIGDLISFYGSISPIMPPQFPYSYDFARHAYFNQVGGTAFSVSNIWIVKRAKETSLAFKIETLRARIFELLKAKLDDAHSGIAAALMIGEQKSIDKEVLNEMRISGLSHILSVSGLHMSLVSIICMFVIRYLLSYSTYIAQQYNTKKIAAFISLIISFGYLLISGIQVAALRAFIMNALIIISILLDRQDNSKRAVFIAAFLILFFNPESIFQPSFQMSFAAVLALVAGYEIYCHKKDFSCVLGMFGKLKFYLFGTLFSSVIASTATSIFVIYHFHTYSVYSVLANLIIAPVVSFIIMPSVIAAFCLMPFKLEWLGLYPMNFGISIMLKVAKYTSALPYANIITPPISYYVPVFFAFGLLWVCIWERKWRWLGVLPMLLTFVIVFTTQFPNLIIDAKYSAIIAKVDNQNVLRIGGPGRVSQFHQAQWLSLLGGRKLKTIPLDDEELAYNIETPIYAGEINLINSTSSTRTIRKFGYIKIMAKDSSKTISFDEAELNKYGTSFIYMKGNPVIVKSLKPNRFWSG